LELVIVPLVIGVELIAMVVIKQSGYRKEVEVRE